LGSSGFSGRRLCFEVVPTGPGKRTLHQVEGNLRGCGQHSNHGVDPLLGHWVRYLGGWYLAHRGNLDLDLGRGLELAFALQNLAALFDHETLTILPILDTL